MQLYFTKETIMRRLEAAIYSFNNNDGLRVYSVLKNTYFQMMMAESSDMSYDFMKNIANKIKSLYENGGKFKVQDLVWLKQCVLNYQLSKSKYAELKYMEKQVELWNIKNDEISENITHAETIILTETYGDVDILSPILRNIRESIQVFIEKKKI